MTGFSSANWDVPPGTGALTVLVLVASALATIALGLGSRGSMTAAAASPVTTTQPAITLPARDRG